MLYGDFTIIRTDSVILVNVPIRRVIGDVVWRAKGGAKRTLSVVEQVGHCPGNRSVGRIAI